MEPGTTPSVYSLIGSVRATWGRVNVASIDGSKPVPSSLRSTTAVCARVPISATRPRAEPWVMRRGRRFVTTECHWWMSLCTRSLPSASKRRWTSESISSMPSTTPSSTRPMGTSFPAAPAGSRRRLPHARSSSASAFRSDRSSGGLQAAVLSSRRLESRVLRPGDRSHVPLPDQFSVGTRRSSSSNQLRTRFDLVPVVIVLHGFFMVPIPSDHQEALSIW